MKLTDLTREQLVLINTDFGEELEKQASAEVDAEYEKLAESEEVAESCYNYGAELAMQKIAAMEEEAKKKEEKKEEEEGEEEEEKEEEKTASAMGNFILEGYWNTMMEKGAEFYGDDSIYLEELCKEAGIANKAKDAAKSALGYVKSYGQNVKNRALTAKMYAKGAFTPGVGGLKKNLKTRAGLLGSAAKKVAPEAAVGAAAVGAGAYGLSKKKNKK